MNDQRLALLYVPFLQVGGLILVVSNSLHLEKQCELFQSGMKRAVQVVKKRTSKHQAIAETLDELQVCTRSSVFAGARHTVTLLIFV